MGKSFKTFSFRYTYNKRRHSQIRYFRYFRYFHTKRNGTKYAAMLISALTLTLIVPVAISAELKGSIDKVIIRGNERLSREYILQFIKHTKPGMPFDPKAIQKDLDALKLTDEFEDVYATAKEENGKITIIFNVIEKPRIKSIDFIGAQSIKQDELRSIIGIRIGEPLDKSKARKGIELIQRKYNELGFVGTQVSLDETLLEEGRVLYNITEGQKVRVVGIRFEGNKAFSEQRLEGIIKTKPYIWIIQPGIYNEEQVREDIFALQNFYRNEGFLDAKVGRRLDYTPDRSKLIITFVIDEGIRYSVGKIRFEGNTYFSSEELLSHMRLQPGGPFRLDWLEADKNTIKELYDKNGFIESQVEIRYLYTEEVGIVDLLVDIKEGRSYKVGRIIIRGNKKTQDRVIRRVLKLYPEDKFDITQLKEDKRRLYETRLFEDIETHILPSEKPEEKDLLIQVQEANTTRLILGIGITSDSGVIGNISLETWNFDLFDWPRSLGEFFRGQAFKGAGQTLRLSIEPGTEITRFRLYFHEPYLFDRPISFSLSSYLFDRSRTDYDERRAGLLVSLGKKIKEDLSLIGSFRLEGIRIYNIDDKWQQIRPEELYDIEGWNLITSLRLTLIRDTTDSFFMPTQGSRLELSWEQAGLFGGDFNYPKLATQFTYYKTLRTDVFDRKTVWASNVFLGYIGEDAPIFERFYGGGIGSVRGFEFRGISPRKYDGELKVGGKFMILVGNELSFPLAGKNLRGVTFLDMGTVEEDFGVSSWRAAVGFGLRVVVDYFGPIPMAFDFAWPIAKDTEDDTQVFSFSLGATFR